MSLDLESVEQFMYREARCLDERRWDDWLALFTDDANYWMPLDPDEKVPGRIISLINEDLPKMQLRCERYKNPLIHAQNPPSRTAHVVSNIAIESVDPESGTLVATASFLVREYRLEISTDWVGTYRYELVQDGDEMRIRRKTVRLPNADAALPSIQIPL